MRQIVITEKMLDQLVGEAQDRLEQRIRNACGFYGEESRQRAGQIIKNVGSIIERLGEDIKDSTL